MARHSHAARDAMVGDRRNKFASGMERLAPPYLILVVAADNLFRHLVLCLRAKLNQSKLAHVGSGGDRAVRRVEQRATCVLCDG